MQDKVEVMLHVVKMLHRDNELKVKNIRIKPAVGGAYKATKIDFGYVHTICCSPRLADTSHDVFESFDDENLHLAPRLKIVVPDNETLSVNWFLKCWFKPKDLSPALRELICESRSFGPWDHEPSALLTLHRRLMMFKAQLTNTDFQVY